MGTFPEVLPGNLVFFHFYYIGTQEIEQLDHTIEFHVKNCINTENFSSCGDTLYKTVSDQDVTAVYLKTIAFQAKISPIKIIIENNQELLVRCNKRSKFV